MNVETKLKIFGMINENDLIGLSIRSIMRKSGLPKSTIQDYVRGLENVGKIKRIIRRGKRYYVGSAHYIK
ncbi:MAG TPA: hypothetical protein ENG87_02710 [Candidatus Pacearchaeota archaeon]|nr:hypothetical protein [Candidatus Pacearchaeota archaeon]HDZ60408.1 hypothetical protein [Candidatus Pacearchaeota archaeon]